MPIHLKRSNRKFVEEANFEEWKPKLSKETTRRVLAMHVVNATHTQHRRTFKWGFGILLLTIGIVLILNGAVAFVKLLGH